MKTSIFKVIYWINKKEKHTYLFVGNTYKNLIKKLQDNKITDEDIKTLKQHFENYTLLDTSLKDESVKLIHEYIFEDDTIYTIKNKIAYHIKNINFDHIYLWGLQKINNYELIDILTNIFNSDDKLNTTEINYILENLFQFKLETSNKEFNIRQIYDQISSNKKFNITVPLELNYYDINNDQKFIPSNPYKKMKINYRFLDSNNKYNPIYKYKLDSFNILKNKIKTNIINFTNSNDIFNAYKKMDETDELIMNGGVKVYFPYISDIDDYDNYNDTYENTIKNTDEIINKFMLDQKDDILKNNISYVNRFHVKINPTIINIKFNNFLINLEGFFNNFITDETIPMIIFKKINNNIYKINKNSLGNKNSRNDKKINDNDLTKWTENINIVRKNEFLEIKILFRNFNDIALTKYFNLIIFDNGRVDVIYDFKKEEPVQINEIINSFSKVNEILNKINRKYDINLINLDDTLFNCNVSYIDFLDYNITNNLTFNDVILSESNIKKSLELFYPYFDVINEQNNFIYIKFKRINNFFDIDNVQSFIEQNISKPKPELVSLLMKKYSVNKTKAEKDYDEISDLIKLNLTTTNKITKSNINKGVFIFLKIKNKLQLQFLVKNLINNEDNILITKLLSFLSTNNDILKDKNKINKQITNFNNFNKDAKENFTEKKEILSDDDFEYLTNSDDFSILTNNENDDDDDDEDVYEMNDDDIKLLASLEADEYDEIQKTKDNTKIDTEIKEKTDNELKIDVNIDFEKLNDPQEKKKYDKLILERLKEADKQLFKKPYTTKCQAVHKKQPVVITKNEKEYIDKNFPNSYTSVIKAGSSDEKKEAYYYICPKYWCPLTGVSLTNKQLKDLDGKCPKGEPPIVLSNKSWVKKDKDGKEYDVPKYPFLLDSVLHPDKKEMPCCRGKPSIVVDDTTKIGRYITQSKLPAKINRYATLPDKLNKILNNKYPIDFKINENTNCFVRKGINDENQYVLASLIYVIDNKKIKNVKEFINAVEQNMTKIDYIELNNGNTLKIFLNPDFSIYDEKNFELFKKNMNSDKDYLNKMDLNDLNKQIKKINKFVYDDTNKYNNDILREFMIFNSFKNFKLYLTSDLFKGHEEVLQLFTNNYEWLNSKKHNIIMFNSQNKNREVEKIDILCSKFINYNTKLNTDNNFVFIIKNENIYEPVVRIRNTNTKKKNDIVIHNSFSYKEDKKFKYIIDLQKKYCKTSKLKNLIDPINLLKILDDLEFPIKAFVINMSFKFVGFLLKNNLFIPIDSNIISTNVFRDNDIIIKNYIYIHNITRFRCKLSSKKIKQILNDLNEKLNKKIYNIKEILTDNTEEIAIILEDIPNNIIPLRILNSNMDFFMEHIKDETIFLGIENKNDTSSYINNYENITILYQDKLKNIINHIVANTKTLKNIEMLKHKHNPFPKNIKIEKIKTIIINIIQKDDKLILNEEETNNIINDIYTKDLLYILRKNDSDLKVQKYEIVFNQDDILNDKLNKLNQKLSNPFKSIENSIEDYILYKGVTIQPTKNDISYKFLTDTYKPLPEYTWKDLLPLYEINLATIEDIDEQNTMQYLIEIFSKISKLDKNSISEKALEKKLDKERENDFKNDKNDKELFIENQKENIYFEKIFDKQDYFDKNDFEQYNKIYDENYKYSFYEIEKLSEIVKVSVIILGNFENKRLTRGHKIYKNGDKYILFNIDSQPKYDKFNIIMKNTNKFIFDKNDLPKKFWNYIDEKKI
tara:strand:+ start:7205 stop:12388 length:5184 start_codon:yes stop_codon:yes gene_type:complete